MSGQTNREQPDDLDDDFIIEDAPVNDLEDLFQSGPAAAKQKKGSDTPDASDVLFQATDPAAAQFEGRPEFAESGSGRWPGHELQPGDIGIPVEGKEDPLTADDGIDTEQELEVIGDDGQVRAPAAGDESFVIDEGQIAGATAGDEGGAAGETDNPYITGEQPEVPVEEGWEPVAATPGRVADDEATLGTVDEEQPAEAEAEPEPALVGAEEIYAEAQAEPVGRVVGAPLRRRRLFALLPSAAAAAVVLAAGTVVVLRPEWLGLHFQPQLVERVQVARPALEVRVPKPPMPVAGAEGPSPSPSPTPDDPQPQPSDPGPENHVPLPGNPPGNPTTPTDPTPPPTQVGKSPAPGTGRMLPAGENLLIGDFTPRNDTDTSWLNVKLGTKAFAQLHNGNFFVGSVKAVSANAVVLHVGSSDAQKTTSEVTLPRSDVERITALDSQEYQELQQATTGSLRLTNNNRLVGTILKSVADDYYVLQMRSDRIVVPKKTAKLITSNSEQLKFAPDSENDDEEQWLHEVAARQLRQIASGQVAAPGLESRPSSLPPSPINRPATAPPRSAPPKPATSATQTAPSTRPAAPIRPANGQKR
jgi:hypothetical protein